MVKSDQALNHIAVSFHIAKKLVPVDRYSMPRSKAAKFWSLRHEDVDVAVMLYGETSPAGLPAVSYQPVRHWQR